MNGQTDQQPETNPWGQRERASGGGESFRKGHKLLEDTATVKMRENNSLSKAHTG